MLLSLIVYVCAKIRKKNYLFIASCLSFLEHVKLRQGDQHELSHSVPFQLTFL
jgi:hypothetical protein